MMSQLVLNADGVADGATVGWKLRLRSLGRQIYHRIKELLKDGSSYPHARWH